MADKETIVKKKTVVAIEELTRKDIKGLLFGLCLSFKFLELKLKLEYWHSAN